MLTGQDATSTLNVATGLVAFSGTGAQIGATIGGGNQGYLNLVGGTDVIFGGPGTTNTINSIITTSAAANMIDKAGAGKIIFTSANQFGSVLVVNEGILNIQNGQALGGPQGATLVNYEAALQIQDPSGNNNSPIQVVNKAITLNGPGASGDDTNPTGALDVISGTGNSWSGLITVGARNGVNALVDFSALFPNSPVAILNTGFISVDAPPT